WEPVGLHIVRASEPFELDQLYQLGLAAIERGGTSAEFWRPTFFDYRNVNLTKFEANDLRRLIEKRKAFGEEHNNNLSVYIVADMGSFGMVRMNNIYAEIAGLRDEENTLVTMEVLEVVDWLTARLGLDQTQKTELVQIIA
ncbi:MAG: hypothetical protein ABJJ37_14840, partial [Roseibium sp.]